jgi:WD40 repeat protein/DNA-binding SARP family transcriptional activator
MNLVEIHLLGLFRATSGGQLLSEPMADKARALLTYLALEGEQPRTIVTALLWPYLPPDAAYDNLRKTLYRLRQRLAESAPGTTELLLTTRQTVGLNWPRVQVDAVHFQNLLAECELHSHQELSICDGCLARLAQAVDLYQGELLAGFGLNDAPAFEEWLLIRRETLHQQALLALTRLSTAWEARGDIARARTSASRTLALDPAREDAHRQQMRLLARLGLPNQALQQYEVCRRLLREELGVEPDTATTALYEQIRRGNFEKGVQRLNDPPEPDDESLQNPKSKIQTPEDWDETPETGRIYGRQTELAQVQGWLTAERCQLVALLGMGGVGKTTLAATAAKSAASEFETVVWRSLINAPPVEELLRDVLPRLAGQPLPDLPASLDEQLGLLLKHLRGRRCLLVLDNLESILQAEGIGQMRTGYEGYTQLLRQVTENKHPSCLLITSRERPQGLARWEQDFSWVRSLRLEGLDPAAGQALLLDRGLSGQALAVNALVQRYSGHPLALKLVVETVQELFGGGIDDFLQEEAPVFDDIRHMLDEQFARLSPLEEELLYWLAIEREPISANGLRADLMREVTARSLLEALRSLQRRSLLEVAAGDCFTLQNVVTEYITGRLIERVCQELASASPDLLVRHALIKADAKEYVRRSQERLILQPTARWLALRLSEAELHTRFRALLDRLRAGGQAGGYAPGNLLNLLLALRYSVQGYDFSHLAVWQAYLRGAALPEVNFAHSDLANSVFTDIFHNTHVIAFRPEGDQLVVGMGDGTIRLWSLAGAPLEVWSGNGKAVWLLAFCPDGRFLATDGARWSINLWDVAHKRVVNTLTGHTTVVHDLAFSPDGALLAACGEDGTVRVWAVESGRTVHVLAGHSDGVECVAFSPDSRWLASGSQDSTVCLWDLQTGTVVTTLRGHTKTVRKVAFCPASHDGSLRLVTASWDQTLRLWDGQTGETIHLFRGHTGELSSLALSSDGSFAISAGDEPTVWVWDLQTGRVRQTLHGHVGWIASAALSHDDRYVATVGFDQTIRLWDLHDAGQDWADGHARLRLQGYHRPSGVLNFDVLPSGTPTLTLVNYDLAVYTWDLETQTLIHTQTGPPTKHDDFAPLALAADGTQAACRDEGYGIQLWSPLTGKVQMKLPGHTASVTALQFSPDGQLLASGSWDTTVRLWQVEAGAGMHWANGRLLATLQAHTTKVTAVAFSPDGRLLASAGRDHVIHIWDVATQRLLATLAGHNEAVLCLAFGSPPAAPLAETASTPCALLVSGSIDRTVRIWRIYEDETGMTVPAPLICARPDQTDSIAGVAISPDGQWVASASWDCTLTLWSAQDGRLVHDLCGHAESVKFLAFRPDSQWLASSSHDETVRLWSVQTGACLATLSPPGPYETMNIRGITGISQAQRAALRALGAVET